jgi:lipopolysaccharide heptosyltransferase I
VTGFLIVRLGSLGDVIHGIPAAAALRARFPTARIDWVTDPRYVELLGLVRGIDRRVPVDTRRVARTLSVLAELRRVRYDAAIDLQGLLKSAVLARAAGARRTIGFPPAHLREPMARFFYTETPDPGPAVHVIDKNLAMLAPLGVDGSRVTFPIDIPSSAVAGRVAAAAGVGGFVLVNPGAAWPNKRWPPARFGALAAAMRERLGLASVVVWGPGEETLAAQVVAASAGAATIAPATSTSDLFALARGARLVVSGDTGPLHIAAAVGAPIVALFGPTFPHRNGPWAAADVSISRDAGCVCHYARECRRRDRCIDEITVAEVMAAAERRIAPASPNPAGGRGPHG